mmetsp:Transcript_107360/g.302113  ORF Transcript_107360/g.302113 Transcript_107360/m.302113 type:complete len:141 (+) Transcript_107360:609-1031(+)
MTTPAKVVTLPSLRCPWQPRPQWEPPMLRWRMITQKVEQAAAEEAGVVAGGNGEKLERKLLPPAGNSPPLKEKPRSRAETKRPRTVGNATAVLKIWTKYQYQHLRRSVGALGSLACRRDGGRTWVPALLAVATPSSGGCT